MLSVYLPMADVTVWIPGLVILGLAVGLLSGLFGVGGGFLLTPALHILFKIPYPVAVGSDLAQIFLTSGVSAAQHGRRGNVKFRLALLLAFGGVAGAEAGKRIMGALDRSPRTVAVFGHEHTLLNLVMNCLFLILMGAVAVMIVREAVSARDSGRETRSPLACHMHRFQWPPRIGIGSPADGSISVWIPIALSVFVGVLTGLMGVGGGFVLFPLLIYLVGLGTLHAVGTSALQVAVASGYGAFRHFQHGRVEGMLVLWLLVGSVAGAQLGVWLAQRIHGRSLRKYFALVLLLGIVLVLSQFVRGG